MKTTKTRFTILEILEMPGSVVLEYKKLPPAKK
jgi:hypothetical protein